MPNNDMNIKNNIAYVLNRSDKDVKELIGILDIIDGNYIDNGIIQGAVGGAPYSDPEFKKKPEELEDLIKRAELLNSRVKENAVLVKKYIATLPDYTLSEEEINTLKATIGGAI